MLSCPSVIDLDKDVSYLPPELWPHANNSNKSAHMIVSNATKKEVEEEHQKAIDKLGHRRFWLWDYLCIPFANIRRHRGVDAAEYLTCQQYLIYYLAMMTAICLFVLLPVNVFGGAASGDAFEKTTINALASDSTLLWIHALVTIVFVILVSFYFFIQTFNLVLSSNFRAL